MPRSLPTNASRGLSFPAFRAVGANVTYYDAVCTVRQSS